MAGKREWDMASTHSLESAAEWLRGKADALLVIIVRPDDVALSADPALAPRDVAMLLEDRSAEYHAMLQEQRIAARERAEQRGQRAAKGAVLRTG